METKKVSFVIPCYKSAGTIEHVIREIEDTMQSLQQYTYELILVNDASPDQTFEVLKELAQKKKNVTAVNLAKNFGQHAALMAGFHYADGDITVCLDDDGQTPANEVYKLLEEIEKGQDVVYAKYMHKKHSLFRNFGSAVNEKMAQLLLGKPKTLYVSSYFAAKKFVIEEMLHYDKSYPYVIGLVLRTTNKISNVTVNHRERESGKSGYTMGKLLGLWLNGFTAFSIQPLRVATLIGTLCAFAGFIYGIYTIVKKLVNPLVPMGFSSLMSAIMFIGGMLMLMLGLVGEYIGRVYIGMNHAPQYVIREIVNGKTDNKQD